MVYRLEEDETRHADFPLRLGAAGTDEVVEAHRIACTHFDAYRFFTAPARPRNTLSPGPDDRAAYEQPGCLHAGMDLYKHAFRLSPMISSDLVADCFELAQDIRVLDMRASPYDLADLGFEPVPIETAEGKREYAEAQRAFAEPGRPAAGPADRRVRPVARTLTRGSPRARGRPTRVARMDADRSAQRRRSPARRTGRPSSSRTGSAATSTCGGTWRPAFEDTHRVVLFDFVGAGGSTVPYDADKYATLDGYAADVLEIIRGLDLRDVVFVGHSVSAMIGALAQVEAPDLFDRLVMVGPSPRYIDDDAVRRWLRRGRRSTGCSTRCAATTSAGPRSMAPLIIGQRRPARARRGAHGELLPHGPCRGEGFATATFLSDHRDVLASDLGAHARAPVPRRRHRAGLRRASTSPPRSRTPSSWCSTPPATAPT